MSCLELQGEVQQDTKQHDADDDQSADRVAQYQRYAASNKKDDDQRIGDQPEKTDESCETRFLQETVGYIETQSLCRLSGTQPSRGCLQQMQQVRQRPIPEPLQRYFSLSHALCRDWALSFHLPGRSAKLNRTVQHSLRSRPHQERRSSQRTPSTPSSRSLQPPRRRQVHTASFGRKVQTAN